jgi:hypothetical protein
LTRKKHHRQWKTLPDNSLMVKSDCVPLLVGTVISHFKGCPAVEHLEVSMHLFMISWRMTGMKTVNICQCFLLFIFLQEVRRFVSHKSLISVSTAN